MLNRIFNAFIQLFLSFLLSYNSLQFAQARERPRETNVTQEKSSQNATKYYEKKKISKPSEKKNIRGKLKTSNKTKSDKLAEPGKPGELGEKQKNHQKKQQRIAAEEKQAWEEYEKAQDEASQKKAWEWKREQELKETAQKRTSERTSAELPKAVEAPVINDPVPKENKSSSPFLPEIEKIIQKDYENRMKMRQEKETKLAELGKLGVKQQKNQQRIQSDFEKNLKDSLKSPLKPKNLTKKLDPVLKSGEIAKKLPSLAKTSDFLNNPSLEKPFFSEYELPIVAALVLSSGLSTGNVALSIIRHFLVKKGTVKEFVEIVLQDPKFQLNLAIALIAPIFLLSRSNFLHFLLIKRFNK